MSHDPTRPLPQGSALPHLPAPSVTPPPPPPPAPQTPPVPSAAWAPNPNVDRASAFAGEYPPAPAPPAPAPAPPQPVASVPLAPPGWYSDPAGSGGVRYWDGRNWTEHVTFPAAYAPYGMTGESPRSRSVAIALCVTLGWAGAHRFYVGKAGTGVLQLLTGGGAGIWWLIDLIYIASGGFTDQEGRPVTRW